MRIRLYCLLLSAALIPTAAAQAQTHVTQDFPNTHCGQLRAGNVADMGFILGSGAHKMSQQKLAQFNTLFSAKLVRDYNITLVPQAGACSLQVVDQRVMGYNAPYKPRKSDNSPTRQLSQVVIGTKLHSQKDTDIVITYKLSSRDITHWVLEEFSINGKPMIANYRKEYNTILQKKGVDALLAMLVPPASEAPVVAPAEIAAPPTPPQ